MIRTLLKWTFALALLAPLAVSTAKAQQTDKEAIGTDIESGRSLDGYFVWGLFAGGALFAVGKTARR
jgi:hypothetical protein